MPRRNRLEDGIQRAVVQYLDILKNKGLLTYIHPPNGGARTKIEASIFKGLGVRAGAPDLWIIRSEDGKAMVLELKAPGQKPTKVQESFLCEVKALNAGSCWADGIDLAIHLIDSFIGIHMDRCTPTRVER
jgi:hypothetical protein